MVWTICTLLIVKKTITFHTAFCSSTNKCFLKIFLIILKKCFLASSKKLIKLCLSNPYFCLLIRVAFYSVLSYFEKKRYINTYYYYYYYLVNLNITSYLIDPTLTLCDVIRHDTITYNQHQLERFVCKQTYI